MKNPLRLLTRRKPAAPERAPLSPEAQAADMVFRAVHQTTMEQFRKGNPIQVSVQKSDRQIVLTVTFA